VFQSARHLGALQHAALLYASRRIIQSRCQTSFVRVANAHTRHTMPAQRFMQCGKLRQKFGLQAGETIFNTQTEKLASVGPRITIRTALSVKCFLHVMCNKNAGYW